MHLKWGGGMMSPPIRLRLRVDILIQNRFYVSIFKRTRRFSIQTNSKYKCLLEAIFSKTDTFSKSMDGYFFRQYYDFLDFKHEFTTYIFYNRFLSKCSTLFLNKFEKYLVLSVTLRFYIHVECVLI